MNEPLVFGETERSVAIWEMRMRKRMSDAEIRDRIAVDHPLHWRDKYVVLLPHLEEIKGLYE